VPADARVIEAVGATLDETAAAEDSICVQSDSEVHGLNLWALLCPYVYLPVQTQVPTGASSGTRHLPPPATSSARQPPSVAWPDATSPEGEHYKIIIAEMASALDASRAAELALQLQITGLRAELRRATKGLSSPAEAQPSALNTPGTHPLRDPEPHVVNAHPHRKD
jgi:hypothetical protein